jgi:hypothetical protein
LAVPPLFVATVVDAAVADAWLTKAFGLRAAKAALPPGYVIKVAGTSCPATALA